MDTKGNKKKSYWSSLIPKVQSPDGASNPSPLLKGGRALSQTVQHLMQGSNPKGFGLVRSLSMQHPRASASYEVSSKSPGSVQHTHVLKDGQEGVFQSLSIVARPISDQTCDNVGSLRRSISEHEKKMEDMSEQLERVTEERDKAMRSNTRLRDCVSSHQVALQTTLQNTQRALQAQAELLAQQDTLIQRLVEERDGEGRLVSLVCMLVSVYVIRTPVMSYTIHLVTRQVTRRYRHVPGIGRWFQYLALLQIYSFLRFMSRKGHIASRVGGGLRWLWSNLQTVASSIITRGAGLRSHSIPTKSLHLC